MFHPQERRMTNPYRPAGFITGGPMGRAAIFLCLVSMLLLQNALAQAPQSSASPAPPEPIRGKGYRLVQNWDFGVNIRDEAQLRQQFHTRYILSLIHI